MYNCSIISSFYVKMHTVYFWVCFVIALFIKEIVTEKCYTPEKQEGQCKPIYNCPKILKAFANPPKGSETYLRQYVCEGGEGLEVCCDNSTSDSTITMLAEQHLIFDSPHVLLEEILPYCHKDERVLPEILAKHPESGVEYVKCFGALINGRYVITAAECVVQNDKSAIVGVRFTSSKRSYFFAVEEEIPHPFYDPVTKINNLALLRLNGTVLEDGVKLYLCIEPYNGDAVEQLAVQRRKRIFISSKLLSPPVCGGLLKNKKVDAVVTEYVLCTEDIRNSTEITCNEYAGSPLIHSNYGDDDKHAAVLLGISSSKIGCADGLSNVYTNLIKYKHWLRDNMRPWWDVSEQCRTPSGEAGQSLPIHYCPALFQMFADARNGTRAYLDKQVNYYDDPFFVCCPKSQNASISENRNALTNIDVPPQFLDERCGLQHRDDYFSSSAAIAIDEFPWIATIALAQYSSNTLCGGVLINARYVLTTAICTTRTTDVHDLIVRLGDFLNWRQEDCIKDVDIDATDCTEAEYFGVEDIILHPFYILHLQLNNLALLRLNKTVQYTDFIRPICLPVPGTVTAKPGDTMYKSGWSTDIGTKLKVLTRLLSYNECQRILRNIFKEYIHAGTICTMGYENTTDHIYGAALMFSNNYQWHVEGIFDINYVGSIKALYQYTDVSKYVNWILDNMRPWK